MDGRQLYRSARRRVASWGVAWPLAAALIGLVCTAHEAEQIPRNAVLVVVDALRADHLGAYGYSRPISPRFDAFASEGLLFRSARSQAPCTFPSVNSLLTSRRPEPFARRLSFGFGIPPRMTTLAEALQVHGFRTAAVSASPIVRATPTRENPEGGFGHGFEVFEEGCLGRDAACVNAAALRLVDQMGEPFFLYLHYMEPHDPYRPPPSHRARFAEEARAPDFLPDGDPKPLARELYREGHELALSADERQRLVDLYDEEIAYFDDELGALLSALEERGLLQRTMLVIASDHGEEFLEHGDLLHCRNVYDTQVRIPLVMRIPGAPGGRLIAAPVQNLDVAPTLLDYLGVPNSALHSEGRSLRSLIEMNGSSAASFSSWDEARAIVSDRFKLILDLDSGRARLYDLEADPGETQDLSVRRPRVVESLRRQLETREARLPLRLRLRKGATEERLRALGYLE